MATKTNDTKASRAEEAQQRFRRALDNSADMIMLIDRAMMRYVDVNETACKLLGYSREELLRMGPQDLLPVSRDELERAYDEFIAYPSNVGVLRSYFRCKDGSSIPFESTRHVLRSGNTYIIASVSRDIRERLAAEEAQREQVALIAQSAEKDRLLRLFYELPFVGLAVTSPTSKRWLQVNDYMCEMLRYPREELLELAWTETTHPDDLAANLALFQRLAAGEFDAFRFDKRFLRKDGGIVDTTTEVRCVRHRDGSVETVVIMVQDITERKRSEAALRESEARFRSLTELSSDLYWEQDDQYRFTSFSGPGTRAVSRRNVVWIGKKRWEQDYINMTADDWAAHIATLDARQQFLDLELCRLDEAGIKVWISTSGEPVFDEAGTFKGYRGVGKDITLRKLAEERVRYLAHHDELTSLPNRTMFSEMLNFAIQQARRYNHNFAVLFIDLDRFKVINDTLGHEAGDELLQEFAARFTGCLRESDVVARLGGDEFVVLLREVSEGGQVAAVAGKILSAAFEPVVLLGQECRVTASIGISMYPADAQDEQSLMKNADIAMYQAKDAGRNGYEFYAPEMNAQEAGRLHMEGLLRHAMEQEEFVLHYQPKVEVRSGRIIGMEALIRWNSKELGLVSPGQFIPIAEKCGLIVPIGEWVLKAACTQSKAWQDQGFPPLLISVNLSPRQFQQKNLVAMIAGVLADTGLAPRLLDLEITEGTIMHDAEKAVALLQELHQLGIQLSIDDFGTGYSSLAYLKRLTVQTLKIDQSFVRDITTDADDAAIVTAVIAMAKSLKLGVVAEGVETEAQLAFLAKIHCDEYQGYYFSRPVPAADFARLLKQP